MTFPFWDKTLISPWVHQQIELEDYWDAPSRALLWQPRTGKTKAAIDAACAWHISKELKTVLIIAPRGVHSNWIRKEIPKHCWVEYSACTWLASRINTRSFAQELDAALQSKHLCFLAFGKESLLSKKAQAAIKAALKRGPCALIVDESHHFRTPGTKRTRLGRGLSKKCVMRRILTGTASGNSPLGLFSQFELLHPGALGFTRFSDFERRYAVIGEGYDPRSGRRFKQIEGYKKTDELMGRVARWSSVVDRKDCEDLPEILISEQSYGISDLQHMAYESMRKNYVAELQSGAYAEAVNSGSRLIKLQQILSNFIVTDSFQIETVDPANDPRLDAMEEAISGPTIIWCRFTEDIKKVVNRLKSENLRVVEYYGAISDKDRTAALDAFQAKEADIFVAQPACAGEGLDLSTAETMIWFSHVFDVIVRDQANERATIVGGNRVSVVDLVAPESVDDYILMNLNAKHSVAEQVTGAELKNILERCRI